MQGVNGKEISHLVTLGPLLG